MLGGWNVEFIRHDFCNEDAVCNFTSIGTPSSGRWMGRYVSVKSPETIIHALFECDYAEQVWSLSTLASLLSTWKGSNLMDYMD